MVDGEQPALQVIVLVSNPHPYPFRLRPADPGN
jgi:hypothetical protein